MNQVIDVLGDNMYVVVIALICLAMLAGSFIRAITSVITTQARERSRREIAAYVAEGSLTPEQGERLMKAEIKQPPSKCCA